MKRKEVAALCAGSSPKARRKFWSIVTNKVKEHTSFSAVLNPDSKVLKCSSEEIVKEVEDHLTRLF